MNLREIHTTTDFGTVTPFLHWEISNIQRCPEIFSSCIQYPIHKLQQFDVDKGLQFYFILHAYNYAGHFCTTKTKSFQVPSKFPPGKGTVYDIDPYTLDNQMDVDVTFKPYTFCCSLKGFLHQKDVIFQVGVGSIIGTNNVVTFHNISVNQVYCNSSSLLSFSTKYYVTVRAIGTGGISTATSNGFIIIDKTKLNDHIKIQNGPKCQKDTFIEQMRGTVNNQSFQSVSFKPKRPFILGKIYTLIMTSADPFIHLNGKDVINVEKPKNGVWTLIATKPFPIITLTNTGSLILNITMSPLILCQGFTNTKIQRSTNTIDINWTTEREILDFVYHFEIGVSGPCSDTNDCFSNEILRIKTESNLLHNKHTFIGLHLSPEMYYKTFISICFQQFCHEPVFSEPVFIENFKPIFPFLKSTLDITEGNCSLVLSEWDDVVCSSIATFSKPIFYQIGIFEDGNGQHQLTPWNYIQPSANAPEKIAAFVSCKKYYFHDIKTTYGKFEDCLQIPSYSHRVIFTCLEVFCMSGRQEKYCVPLNVRYDPNLYLNHKVYDVVAKTEYFQSIIPYLGSKYIGDKLSVIHDNEVDFITPWNIVAGVLLGVDDRLISWFLMRRQGFPIGSCNNDLDCIYEDATTKGYIAFKNVQLKDEHIYYICAKSDKTVIQREFFTEEIPAFESCSNGFMVDSSPPKPGDVTIVSRNGYITDKSELLIHWDDFKDSALYLKMGYNSGIAFYQYSIGSYPYGQDVLPYTNISTRTAVIVSHPNLISGAIYYATIKATDLVGLSTKSLSEGVVFDETPPTQGIMFIDGIHSNEYLVTPQQFSIHWSGFEDKDSGIHSFELAIGTTKNSQDILPFALFNDNFAVFTNLNMLLDGHGYFAILKVTNKAGLITVSTSERFYIDSTPPQNPIVIDGLSGSQYDLDYQTESTALYAHWTECFDPHSIIMYYRAGVGSKPNTTDVIPFVFIGLQQGNA
ncbi:hypothetical protein KUTeg_009425 [Tegillarca granosa]|uniref:Uncharacterized protein n=1 Tax=Tegillarca granosa TaxID=220873 RepID=A0ABQ9F3T6_TEGGR|nr:hypothetical protein KUTeg_009425 [Tegillarca granosa]